MKLDKVRLNDSSRNKVILRLKEERRNRRNRCTMKSLAPLPISDKHSICHNNKMEQATRKVTSMGCLSISRLVKFHQQDDSVAQPSTPT